MTENFEDELSVEERKAMNSLARENQPPPFLEERVVARLRESNVLHVATPRWRRSAPRILVGLAAALLIFFMGTVVGTKWWARPTPNTPQFMLVLKAGAERSQPNSSEETIRRVGEYSTWARQLRQQSVRVEGEKLKQEARVLGQDTNQLAAENKLAQPQRMSGYFLIDAKDFDEAVQIASGCPHLKYGGTIEVRQIDRF